MMKITSRDNARVKYVAKLATDKALRGAPSGHVVDVREVRLSAGAGFVVMICGSITTMPGLPAVPAASTIDVTDEAIARVDAVLTVEPPAP